MKGHPNLPAAVALATLAFAACRSTGPAVSSPAAASPSLAPLSTTPPRYFDALRRMGEANQWNHGPRRLHADDHAVTQSYFLLHEREKDPRMVAKALAAALNRAVLPDGKLGYVQRVGAAPGDTSADETEVYGVGAFLLAGSEVHQLARAR